MQLVIGAKNLTGATVIALDEENGYVYLGDRFPRGDEIRIQRLELETGEIEELYPARNAIVSWFDGRPRLKAPVGGLLVHEGELYVTARGGDGLGLDHHEELAILPPAVAQGRHVDVGEDRRMGGEGDLQRMFAQ